MQQSIEGHAMTIGSHPPSPRQDVPLSQLAKMLPVTVSYWTLWQWTRNGAKSRTGKTVTLQTVRLPSGTGSSLVKYARFIKQLQG